MRTKDIIQPLVGTKNIVVKDIFLDAETSDLVISAWPTKKERCQCGLYHREAKYYDAGRTLDIDAGKVFIEAPVPRVCYKKHGVKIKLLIRTAYGFTNTDSLIAMVMLSCSSVQPRLPGR